MGGLQYVGDGTYIPGVPARDLREEEAVQFAATIQEYETAMGIQLYAPVQAAWVPPVAVGEEEVVHG